MIAVDTNVLVRLAVKDNEAMSKQALRLLERHGLFVAKTVAIESYWVLRRRLGWERSAVFAFLRTSAAHPAILFEDGDAIVTALETEVAGLEFDDALHAASTPAPRQFVTFDKTFVKRAARSSLPTPVISPESYLS